MQLIAVKCIEPLQIWSMLHGRSTVAGGRDFVSSVSAHKDSQ